VHYLDIKIKQETLRMNLPIYAENREDYAAANILLSKNNFFKKIEIKKKLNLTKIKKWL
jgi:hypothetical protein